MTRDDGGYAWLSILKMTIPDDRRLSEVPWNACALLVDNNVFSRISMAEDEQRLRFGCSQPKHRNRVEG